MLSVSQYLVFILASPLVLGAPTSSFSALTKAVSAATASSSFATTENNQTCGALNVIFARGTTEPGNVSMRNLLVLLRLTCHRLEFWQDPLFSMHCKRPLEEMWPYKVLIIQPVFQVSSLADQIRVLQLCELF